MKKLWRVLLLGLLFSGGVALAQEMRPMAMQPNNQALGAQIQALQTQVSQLQQQVTSANQNVSLLTNQVLQLQKTMTVQTNTVTNRIADLEQRFKTHTHGYTYEHLNYGTVDAGGAIASRINGNQMDAAKTSPPN